MVVRVDREARLEVSCGHRAGEIGVYENGYKPDGVPNPSGTWKLLGTKISYSVDTPFFPNAMNYGQLGSTATLIFVIECHR